MSKTTLAGIIVLIIGGALVAAQMAKPDAADTSSETNTTASATATPTASSSPTASLAAGETPAVTAGSYVEYKSDILATTTGTRILFFHASWCPQCRQLESDIKASTIPNDVTIIKVDYDSNQALRKQYGVTLQTTLVKVDANGELVERFVAYDDPSFAKVQAELL